MSWRHSSIHALMRLRRGGYNHPCSAQQIFHNVNHSTRHGGCLPQIRTIVCWSGAGAHRDCSVGGVSLGDATDSKGKTADAVCLCMRSARPACAASGHGVVTESCRLADTDAVLAADEVLLGAAPSSNP